MIKKMLGTVGYDEVAVRGSASGSKGSAIKFARQRKVSVASPGQDVGDSVVVQLPQGVPPSVRQQVKDAIQDCVARVVSAVMSIKTVVREVVASNVNRVTQNGDEYLLETQNGKIIALKDCKMVRVFLMFVINPRRALSAEQIETSEKIGHYKLPPVSKDGLDHNSGIEKEDVDALYEFRKNSPNNGGRSCSGGFNREQTRVVERQLKLSIAQAGRDIKHAKSTRDQGEVENKKQWRASLRDKLDELIRERSGRKGPVLSHEDKERIRRIQMVVSHFLKLISKKDEVLAKSLDYSIIRDGRFEFFGDPKVQWEVCDNLIEPIKRMGLPRQAVSRVSEDEVDEVEV